MQLGMPNDFTLPDERTNYHHLVRDIAWFGLALAATSRFLSIYAIRLGATPMDLGLISSLPAVIMVVSTSFGHWWIGRNRNHPVRALRWPGLLYRLLFLLPAFAPFFPDHLQPAWLVASVALPAIPQGIAGVTFLVMMRQAIDQRHITALTSNRMLMLNVAVGAAALGFGLWLEKTPFPFNYQAMFVLAFVFSLVSVRHCLQVRLILPVWQKEKAVATGKTSVWRAPVFLRLAFVLVASHIAFTSIVPITPIRLMEDLGATEGFMALFGLAELVAGATISMMTTRIAGRIGNQAMVALGMIATAMAGILIATAPDASLTLVAAALSGAGWTAAAIGVFGFFMESTPEEHSSEFMVAYQQVAGLALFVGPMIGSTLVNSGVNVALVVLLGAGLRLLSAALIEYNVFMKSSRVWMPRFRHVAEISK